MTESIRYSLLLHVHARWRVKQRAREDERPDTTMASFCQKHADTHRVQTRHQHVAALTQAHIYMALLNNGCNMHIVVQTITSVSSAGHVPVHHIVLQVEPWPL